LRISCVAASHATLTAISSTEATWAGLLGSFSCNRSRKSGEKCQGVKSYEKLNRRFVEFSIGVCMNQALGAGFRFFFHPDPWGR